MSKYKVAAVYRAEKSNKAVKIATSGKSYYITCAESDLDSDDVWVQISKSAFKDVLKEAKRQAKKLAAIPTADSVIAALNRMQALPENVKSDYYKQVLNFLHSKGVGE